MNLKLKLLSMLAFLAGLSGVSLAQVVGNPFATLGLDFYGFFLPWIFTFAIVFGLLSKLKLFEKNERVSAALAFVIAFFVTGVGGAQLALFFTTLFGGASMFLAGILVIMLFVALVGGEEKFKGKLAVVVIVAVVGVFLFFASGSGFVSVAIIGPDIATVVFWLIIIALAIWFVMHGGKEEGAAQPTK